MVNVKRKVLAWILSVLTILASCAGAVVPSFGEEVIASSSAQESPKVQVLVDVETCGGSVVVGEGTKDQVTLCRNEDGALREVDASGEEMVLDEPGLLIRDVGEVLPIRAVSEKGYEVASYTVQSSFGEEENLFPQSDSCYFEVIADTNKAVSVRFEKKEEVQKSSADKSDEKEKKVEKTPTPTKEAKREAKIIRSGTVNGHHWEQTEDGDIILDDGTVYHPVYPSKEAVEKRASEDHSSTEDSSTDKNVRNLLDPADFWLASADMELVGAASAPSNVPRSFSGSGTVVWRDNGTESYAFKFAVTSGSPAGAKTGLGQVSLGCADYTAAAPEVGMNCSYTATYQSWDPATGTAKYELYATPPGATDGVSRNAYGLMGYQHLSGVVSLRFPTDGHLKLQKVSANPSITKGNACYSLSGAVYGVYKDAACTTLATGSYADNGTAFDGYLKTGNDGTSRKVKIPEGTYYIKEKSASKGYKVDASRHVVAIKNGETALVKSEEVPVNDPGSIVLKKKSSDEQAGLGEASLRGAKFQLKEDWEGGKTYIFETNEKGNIKFAFPEYLSADSKNVPIKNESTNMYLFALGSYTITEISAPAGYLPMEGELKVEVVEDSSSPSGAKWKILSGDRDITQSVDASGEVNWELIEYVAPYIHTEATDANTKSHLGVRKSEDTLVDTVTYGGLDPKTTYVLTGTLMDKETGKEVPGVSTKPVTFQPSAANGTENVTFTFDSTTLAQGDVVVFETLTKKSDGESVAEHKDLSDKGQTVVYPSIGTTATDAATKDHDASYGSDVEIVDEVRVGHLVPYVTDADGNETKEPVVYTIKGHLVFQKDFTTVDGKTFAKGDTVPLVNGTKNEVEKTFTAADVSDGKIFLSFHVDTANLTGAEVVAFERLYQDDILLDAEENIENGSQKVAFPKEETTFLDKKNKEHVLYADGQDVEVEDVIKASHLIDGKDYVQEAQLLFASDFTDANGTVHAKGEAIDEAWAKQTVRINSKTEGFTVEKKTTEQAGDASITYVDGEIRVPFTIPASFIKSCAGADLVAFEKLKSAGGVPVAAHEDVSDENQTIHIPGGGTHAMDGIDLSEEEWNALSQEELKALYENHTPQMCELAATEEVRIADLVYYENLKADTT